MKPSIHLGRIAGIPIGLHYTWFIIAALITVSLASHFSRTAPQWPPLLTWGTAAFTAVLFFAALLAHELSHAMVALAKGLPVRSITLFALGGVAQIEKDASDAKTEFLIAIAGPIASVVIGVVCMGVAQALGWSMQESGSSIAGEILGWLGSINVLLALFNLIPGYPLDGGRVLRAILWGIYGDGNRATRTAASVGQLVAALFIGFGILQVFAGAGAGGLWLAFIGWFLLMAAQASYAQVTITEALRGIRVADVMTSDCETADARTTVKSLVEDIVLRTGHRCIMITSDGRLRGLVTPHDLRALDRARWAEVTVGEVMKPLEHLRSVTPDTPVADAFSMMAREDINQLPVMTDGQLHGMITRGHVIQLLEARSELGLR
ncbi:MAG TPA: site-2 protease family protein [Vicinamibacterales bacterium]|nr:site-2 protease family protein [Vicinamibacterales bacterium]